MRSEPSPSSPSKVAFWAGWVMTVLPALLLLLAAVMNLAKPDFVVKGTTEMGYPEGVIVPLGAVLLVCTLLYLAPPTAVLGAVLLTGYLGGAVATHVHHGDPLFNVLFPVAFAALLWGALVLRDPRLRALLPWRRVK